MISTIKTKPIERQVWLNTTRELELVLVIYIGWYHKHRLQRFLKGRTILEVRIEYDQHQSAV